MKKKPSFRTFFLLSILIHLMIAITHKFFPKTLPSYDKKEPIKVKFSVPKKPEIPTFIETSKPKKINPPINPEFLSKFNSKALSPKKTKKNLKQESQKASIPKLTSKKNRPTQVPSQRPKVFKKSKKVIKKRSKSIKKELKKQILKNSEKKIKTKRKIKTSKRNPKLEIKEKLKELTFEPFQKNRQQQKSSEFPHFQSLLAMIDGIDPEKFASIETNKKDSGDEEEVSLNTKEIKYADYMARIKHQIEKVWIYPEEAARKGINGKITLKFKLSKDGNLLSIHMVESSGIRILDVAAIKAVKGAAPYYPFPATITTKKLNITASFIYSPSYGNPYAYR